MANKHTFYACGNYPTIEIELTIEDACSMSHQGACDKDVETMRKVPYIAQQLERMDPENLRKELKEYGAWNEEQLKDHEENILRILWILAGNIKENNREGE